MRALEGIGEAVGVIVLVWVVGKAIRKKSGPAPPGPRPTFPAREARTTRRRRKRNLVTWDKDRDGP